MPAGAAAATKETEVAPHHDLPIDFATNLRLAMMFKTYIATGMCESELIGLLWDMIDWQRGEIKLTSQLKLLREEKHWERISVKGRRNRNIPLDSDYLAELRTHRVRQMEEKLRRGDEWHEHGLVSPPALAHRSARAT